jgi:hypothetical protein
MYLAIMGKCHVNGLFHVCCLVLREDIQEVVVLFYKSKMFVAITVTLDTFPSHFYRIVYYPSDVAVLVKALVCNSVECRCDALQDVTIE